MSYYAGNDGWGSLFAALIEIAVALVLIVLRMLGAGILIVMKLHAAALDRVLDWAAAVTGLDVSPGPPLLRFAVVAAAYGFILAPGVYVAALVLMHVRPLLVALVIGLTVGTLMGGFAAFSRSEAGDERLRLRFWD